MTLTEFYAAVGGSYEDASARLQNDAFIGGSCGCCPAMTTWPA